MPQPRATPLTTNSNKQTLGFRSLCSRDTLNSHDGASITFQFPGNVYQMPAQGTVCNTIPCRHTRTHAHTQTHTHTHAWSSFVLSEGSDWENNDLGWRHSTVWFYTSHIRKRGAGADGEYKHPWGKVKRDTSLHPTTKGPGPRGLSPTVEAEGSPQLS